MNDTNLQLATSPTASAMAVNRAVRYMAAAADDVDGGEGTSAVARIKSLFKLRDWDDDDKELERNAGIFYEQHLPEGAGDDSYMYGIMSQILGMNAYMRHATSYYSQLVSNMIHSYIAVKNEDEVSRNVLKGINENFHYQTSVKKEKDQNISNAVARVFGTDSFLLRPAGEGYEIEFGTGPLYPSKLPSMYEDFGMRPEDAAGFAIDIDEEQTKGRDAETYATPQYESMIKTCKQALEVIETYFGVKLDKRSSLTKTYSRRVSPKSFNASRMFPGVRLKEDEVIVSKFTQSQITRLEDLVELKVTLHPNEGYLKAAFEEKVDTTSGKKQFIDRDIDPVVALLGVSISVMPVLKMNTKMAEYVSQSSPVSTATLWMWVRQWINGWFVNQTYKISDFVVPLSKSAQITARKKELGVYVQNTRSNKDDFNVDTDGVFQYTPETQTDSTLALKYEEMVDKMVRLSAEIGEPISPTRVTLDSMQVNASAENLAKYEACFQIARDLKALERLPLVVSWDLNLAMCLNDFGVQEIALEGACVPRDSSVGSILTRPAQETMLRFIKGSYSPRGAIAKGDQLTDPKEIKDLPVTEYAARIASYLAVSGSIKTPTEYLKLAAAKLGRTGDGKLTELDPEFHILLRMNPITTATRLTKDEAFIGPNGIDFGPDAVANSGLGMSDSYRDSQRRVSHSIMREGSFLNPLNNLDYNFDTGVINSKLSDTDKQWLELVEKHALYQHFFRAFFDFLAELSNESWGYAWKRALSNADSPMEEDERQDIIDSYKINLFGSSHFSYGDDTDNPSTGEDMARVLGRTGYGVAFSMMCSDILDAFKKSDIMTVTGKAGFFVHKTTPFLPNYKQISMGTLPWLYLWGKILPETEKYVAAHKISVAKNHGTAELPEYATGQDFKLFPHQDHILRINAAMPDVQVGDTAPGGGKTTMNILSAINFITNHNVSRVFVLAPNNLLVNYANDLQMLSGHNWNYIPLVTDTFNRWGEEALANMIINAPRNTIIGIGMDWLSKANKSVVQIGTVQRDIYQSVEFIRQLLTDNCAILIDEAHKLRKYSQRNKCVTTIMHDPRVKYKIQVTGTIVVDDLTDVIPQARLYDPMIYGSVEEFRDNYFNGSGVWTQDSIREMRKKLSQETAFSRFTKKDWAFCLPSPIEDFQIVKLGKDMQAVYDAILKETLAKIKEDAAKNPALQKLLDSLAEGTDNDDSEADVAGLLSPYMARLERFLMDPEGDLLGAKLKGSVSPKIQYAITVLKQHFDGYTEIVKDTGAEIVHKADPNKVIITCRYKRSAAAMYRNLPPELKRMAVYYDAGHVQNKQRFDTDPNCRIICAVEHSIIEGFNMQNASRIIRMESLWSPGELDQMTSRIFRPDVDNKFGREHVWLNWIITDNSMETAKIARLISKMMAKAAFDEYGNSEYDRLPQLPKVRMTLDTFRKSPSFSDYKPYMDGYRILNKIRGDEFMAARKATRLKYGDKPFTEIKGGKLPDDFKIIRTPVFPGSRMPDPLGHGYKLVNTYFLEEENAAIRDTPDALVGRPVRTDTGHGIITKVVTGIVIPDTDSEQAGDEDSSNGEVELIRLKSLTIEYADYFNEDGSRYVERMSGSRLNMTFLGENVPAEDMPLYTDEHHWESLDPSAMRLWADETLNTIAATKKQQEEATTGKKGAKVKKGDVAKEPVIEVTPAPFQQGNVEEDYAVTCHIASINGVPAIYVDPSDPDVSVIDWVGGMQEIGTYLYSHAVTIKDFNATMLWLSSNYTMAQQNIDYLNLFADLFKSGKNRRFDASLLGTMAEIRSFHQAKHVKKPAGQLSVYPMVEDGQFYFVVDKKSNASATALKNKIPTGSTAAAKWYEAGPFQMFLLPPGSKKTAIANFFKNIVKQGFTIANDADLREQYKKLDW